MDTDGTKYYSSNLDAPPLSDFLSDSTMNTSDSASSSHYLKRQSFSEGEEGIEMGTSGFSLKGMLSRCIPSFAGIKDILSSVSGHLKEPVAGAYTLELFLGHSGYYLNRAECTGLEDYIKELMVEKYQNNDAVLGIPNLFSVDPDTSYSRLGTEYAYNKAIKEITAGYGRALPCLTGKGQFRQFCIKVVNKTKELKGHRIQSAIAGKKAKGEASGLIWKPEITFKQQICPQLCQFSGGNSMLIMMSFYDAKKIRDAKLERIKHTYNSDIANGMDSGDADIKKEAAKTAILDEFKRVKQTVQSDAFDGVFLTLVMSPPKEGDKPGLQCVFQIKDGQVFNKLELDHYLGIFDKFDLERFVANDAAKIRRLSRRLYNSVIDLINSCNAMGDKNYNVVIKTDTDGALVITECTTILLCLLSHILVDFIDQIRRNGDFIPIFYSAIDLVDFITKLVGQNKLKIYEESTGCKSVDFDNPTTDPIIGVQKLIHLFEGFGESESQEVLETPLAKIKEGLTSINRRLMGGISSFGSAIASSSSSSSSNSNSSVNYADAVALLRKFEEVEDLIKSDEQEIETELLLMAAKPENSCLSSTSSVSSECPIERVIKIEGLKEVEDVDLSPYKEGEGEDADYEKRMEFIDAERKNINFDDAGARLTFAVAPKVAAPSSSISAASFKINNKRRLKSNQQNPVIKALKKTTEATENIGGRRPIRKTKNNRKNKRRQTKKKVKRRITKKRRMVKRHRRQTNKKH